MSMLAQRTGAECSRLLAAALAAVAAAFLLSETARATDFVVTNGDDHGPGSLRQAVDDANATPGQDTITFAPSGPDPITIRLEHSLVLTDRDATVIDGGSLGAVIVDGGGLTRVFDAREGAAAEFRRLRIVNGTAGEDGGGGLRNAGAVVIADCALEDNTAVPGGPDPSGRGGAVLNLPAGTLSVINATFARNQAANGGAIYNEGWLNAAGISLAGNTASADGGGVLNTGQATLVLAGGAVTGNHAGANGGGLNNQSALPVIVRGTGFLSNTATLGAGICNTGSLVMTGARLAGNAATVDGGGLYNVGTASITGSAIGGDNPSDGNRAIGGGGITNWGAALDLADSRVAGNRAVYGGGIQNGGGGAITLTASFVTSNTGAILGGGLWVETGTATIVDSEIRANLTTDAGAPERGGGGIRVSKAGSVSILGAAVSGNASPYGAGICNEGALTVTESTIADNRADRGGGAFNLPAATLFMVDSAISENAVSHDGGGIFNQGAATIFSTTVAGNTAASGGGGIVNTGDGKVEIRQSTLSANTAGYGGAVQNGGTGRMTMVNATLSRNFAAQYGGGVRNIENGATVITSTTLYDNAAGASGAAVSNHDVGTVSIAQTILYGSSGANCLGAITSNGYNLASDSTCNGLAEAYHDQVAMDPLLGRLVSHDHSSTHALLPGSPALDAVPCDPGAADVDQRGKRRPQGPACDIGAYERIEALAIVLAGDLQATASITPGAEGETGAIITATNNSGLPGLITATVAVYDPDSMMDSRMSSGLTGGLSNLVWVGVSGTAASSTLALSFHYPSTVSGNTEAELRLVYYREGAWVPVTDSAGGSPEWEPTDNAGGTISGGRITAWFDDQSSPAMTQMESVYFAVVSQPAKVVFALPAPIYEGTPFTGTVSIDERHAHAGSTLTVDFGDQTPSLTFTTHPSETVFTFGHRYDDVRSYSLAATLKDNGNVMGAQTERIAVLNVPPTILPVPPIAGDNIVIADGNTFTHTFFINDPGSGGSFTGTVDFGDGPPEPIDAIASSRVFTIRHSYGFRFPDPFMVKINVDDVNGGRGQYVLSVACDGCPLAAYEDVGRVRVWGTISHTGASSAVRGHFQIGPSDSQDRTFRVTGTGAWTESGPLSITGLLSLQESSIDVVTGTLQVDRETGAVTIPDTSDAQVLITHLGNNLRIPITPTLSVSILEPVIHVNATIDIVLPEGNRITPTVGYDLDADGRISATSQSPIQLQVAGQTLDASVSARNDVQPGQDGLRAESAILSLPAAWTTELYSADGFSVGEMVIVGSGPDGLPSVFRGAEFNIGIEFGGPCLRIAIAKGRIQYDESHNFAVDLTTLITLTKVEAVGDSQPYASTAGVVQFARIMPAKETRVGGRFADFNFRVAGLELHLKSVALDTAILKADSVELLLPKEMGRIGTTIYGLVIDGKQGISIRGAKVALPDFSLGGLGFREVMAGFRLTDDGYEVEAYARLDFRNFGLGGGFTIRYDPATQATTLKRIKVAYYGQIAAGTAIPVMAGFYITRISGEFDLSSGLNEIIISVDASTVSYGDTPLSSITGNVGWQISPFVLTGTVSGKLGKFPAVSMIVLITADSFNLTASLETGLFKATAELAFGMDAEREFTLYGALGVKGLKVAKGQWSPCPFNLMSLHWCLPAQDIWPVGEAAFELGKFHHDGSKVWGARGRVSLLGIGGVAAFVEFSPQQRVDISTNLDAYRPVRPSSSVRSAARASAVSAERSPDDTYIVTPTRGAPQLVIAEIITSANQADPQPLLAASPDGQPVTPTLAYSQTDGTNIVRLYSITLAPADGANDGAWTLFTQAGNLLAVWGLHPAAEIAHFEACTPEGCLGTAQMPAKPWHGEPPQLSWEVRDPDAGLSVEVYALDQQGLRRAIASQHSDSATSLMSTTAWNPVLPSGIYTLVIDVDNDRAMPSSLRLQPIIVTDDAPPAAPVGVIATAQPDGSVLLTWTEPGQAEPDLAGYVVTVDNHAPFTITGRLSQYAIYGLAADSSHSITLAAYDLSGNISQPSTVELAMPAEVLTAMHPGRNGLVASVNEVAALFSGPLVGVELSLADSRGDPVAGETQPIVEAVGITQTAAFGARFTPVEPLGVGTYTATVMARGQQSLRAVTASWSFNVAITVQVGALDILTPPSLDEGDTYTGAGSFDGPATTSWTVQVNYGDSPDESSITPKPDHSFDLAHAYLDGGIYTIVVTATGRDGNRGTGAQTIVVREVAPRVLAGHNFAITEGSAFTSAGTFEDPGADSWTATVDYGDGDGDRPLALNPDHTFTLSRMYANQGEYQVAVTVADDDGAAGRGELSVTVGNVPPAAGPVSLSANPIQAKTVLSASAAFTDPGLLDAHTAVWDWGDGTTAAAVISEAGGRGTAQGAHAYAAAGFYFIKLTVTDADGGGAQSASERVVVHDPAAGFVTGGGWVSSGGTQTLFSLVAKYLRSDGAPAGGLQVLAWSGRRPQVILSRSLQWLVIAGRAAVLRGQASANGAGGYTFEATAVDGAGRNLDTFALRVWNRRGQLILDQPAAAVRAGSIVIHAVKPWPPGWRSAESVDEDGLLLCVAADQRGSAVVDPAALESDSAWPQVAILAPEGCAVIPPASQVPLQGFAYDPQDGWLPESALRWSSSASGDLGAGSLLMVDALRGSQVITLTATDSDGHAVTAGARLTIGHLAWLPVVQR